MRLMSKRIDLFCCSMIMLSIFFSAIFSTEIVGVMICTLLSLVLGKHNYGRKDPGILIFGYILIIFQNLLIGIGAHLGHNVSRDLIFLSQVPTVYVVCVGGNCFIKDKNKNIVDGMAILLLFSIMTRFLLSQAPISARLVYTRNCSVFYFAYLIGRRSCDRDDHKKCINAIVDLSVLLVILGIVMLFLPAEAWKHMGIREVYIAKGTSAETFASTGLPVRFYTSIGRSRFYRMASILYEPVNLSYILAAAWIMIYLSKDIKARTLKGILLVTGIILTFGKGGMLISGLIVFCDIYLSILGHVNGNTLNRLKRISAVLIIVMSVFVMGKYYFRNIGGSATPHFYAIVRALPNILKRPFGNGLGYGGNYGISRTKDAGQESGLMAVMVQFGIPFTILFIAEFILMSQSTKNKKNGTPSAVSMIPVAVIAASLFQENTLGTQCCYLFMCMAGMWACEKKWSRY